MEIYVRVLVRSKECVFNGISFIDLRAPANFYLHIMFKRGVGQNGQRERLLITCSMICIDLSCNTTSKSMPN